MAMLIGIAVILLLVVGLLAIPVDVAFDIKRHEQLVGDVGIRWLFGLVNTSIPIKAGTIKKQEPDNFSSDNESGINSQTTSQEKEAVTHKHRMRWSTLLSNANLRRRVVRFVTDFWASFHKKAVTLNLWYGLDDPADTGQLCAIIGPIVQLLRIPDDVSCYLQPVFTGKELELRASGDIWLRPLTVIAVIVGFLLSPTIWLAWYKARR